MPKKDYTYTDEIEDPNRYYTNQGSSKKLDMAISDETV
jgi:hypothetical protein